jgi:methyltransferase (TIGR00027 family)
VEPGQASRTAERVAERRAAHQLLDVPVVFHDPLAFCMLQPEVAARIRSAPHELDRSPIGKPLRAFLAARSQFAEDTLKGAIARGVGQYVIVGAGFDTFSGRNPYPGIRVFEIDHPATQAEKKRRLAASGIQLAGNVSLIPADLSVRSLGEALAASDFDPGKPAVFAWLGVIPYLELPAIESTFQYVATLPSGTAIVYDYGIPRQSLNFIGRLVFDRVASRVATIGEPWKTFFTPEDLRRRLQGIGFSAVEDLGANEINARYFAGRSDRLRVGEAGRIAKAVV